MRNIEYMEANGKVAVLVHRSGQFFHGLNCKWSVAGQPSIAFDKRIIRYWERKEQLKKKYIANTIPTIMEYEKFIHDLGYYTAPDIRTFFELEVDWIPKESKFRIACDLSGREWIEYYRRDEWICFEEQQ